MPPMKMAATPARVSKSQFMKSMVNLSNKRAAAGPPDEQGA